MIDCPQENKNATLRPRSLYLFIANSIPHPWPCIHVVCSYSHHSCSLHALPECLRVCGAVEIAGGSGTGTGSEKGAGGTVTDAGSSEVDTGRGAGRLFGGCCFDSEACEA